MGIQIFTEIHTNRRINYIKNLLQLSKILQGGIGRVVKPTNLLIPLNTVESTEKLHCEFAVWYSYNCKDIPYGTYDFPSTSEVTQRGMEKSPVPTQNKNELVA